MMKHITIIQENTSPIIIDDDDNTPLNEYINELTKILESNNISLIYTTSCSIILRPHKITSIVVKEDLPNISTKKTPEKKNKKIKESSDGIITD